MHTLLYYIKKTASCRKSQKVFVSYVTFNAVSTCTLARWLKTVLNLAGLDTFKYKVHSYRSESTSAAYNKGRFLKLQIGNRQNNFINFLVEMWILVNPAVMLSLGSKII